MAEPSANLYIELRALVAKFNTDMDSATKTVTGFHNNITKTFANIQKVAQAALGVAGVIAIKRMSDALLDLAQAGDAAQDLTDNFKKLGGSSEEIDRAKKAVLGTVSAFDLMAAANKGLIKDIPQLNSKFAEMAGFSKRFAEANGKDTVAVLNEFTEALVRGKAKGLEPFGFILDKSLSKAQVWKEVMGQLATVTDQLAEPTDSVAEAQEAVNVSWDDALKKIGMGVNANQELTIAYRMLQEQLDNIDWETFGKNVSTIAGLFITLGSEVIPTVTGALQGLIVTWEKWTNTGVQGQLLNIADDIDAKRSAMESLEKGWTPGALLDQANGGRVASQLRGQIMQLEQKRNTLLGEYDKEFGKSAEKNGKKEIDISEEVKKHRLKLEKEFDATRARMQVAAGAKEARAEQKKIEATKKKWQDALNRNDEKSLQQQLKKSIESLDQTTFDGLITNFQESVQKGFVDEWQDAVKSGAISLDEVQKQGKVVAQEAAESWHNEMTDKVKDHQKQMEQVYANIGDDIADDMAALGEAFDINLRGIQQAFNELDDSTKAALTKYVSDVFGLTAAQFEGYFSTFATIAGFGANAGAKDKSGKNNAGTGQTVGAVGGAAVAGYFSDGDPQAMQMGAQIGAVLGEVIGKTMGWGANNPETLARHSFANWIEDEFHKLDQISFFNQEGNLVNHDAKKYNFMEGDSTRFNEPGWADDMASWGKAADTFGALGQSLKEIQGISEDVGAQIGYMLGTQLGGNIDNARLLVMQLGLDMKTLEEALLTSAQKGSISWQEYSIQVAGLSEAFKPGLEKVAALSEAWDEFVQSGGRGMAAIKAGKDIGQEAIEAGAKTFDEAREKLIALGKDPAQVSAFFDALEARGIDTFKKLGEAEEAALGGAIGDAGNNSKALSDLWAEAAKAVDSYKAAIDSVPEEVHTKIYATTEMDDDTRLLLQSNGQSFNGTSTTTSNGKVDEFANGGVITGSTLFGHSGGTGVAGENPGHHEAVFPLTKIGGKLSIIGEAGGRGGGNSIYIDARNAEAGVGAEIERVMRDYGQMIVQEAVDATRDVMQRQIGG